MLEDDYLAGILKENQELQEQLEALQKENERISEVAKYNYDVTDTYMKAAAHALGRIYGLEQEMIALKHQNTFMRGTLEQIRKEIKVTYFRGDAYLAWEFYHTVNDALKELDKPQDSKD